MQEEKYYIRISTNEQKRIAKEMEVDPRSVRSAAVFDTYSPVQKAIRRYAIECGCKLYLLKEVENPMEAIRSIHESMKGGRV